MYNKDLLSNQRILVTGGGSGLGLAIALRCAELGATVAICGRSDDRLQAAVETAHQQGSKLLALSADVRDATQVAQMFEALDQQIGGVTSLVNNAAGNFYCASEELTPNGFRAVIDTVLHGTFHCTTEFGRRSISANRPGNILNIVTTYTQTGSAFVLPSACAKAGVYAMTTSLAWEWAEYQLRVNAIAPGPIPTEGAWKRLMPDDAFAERYRETLPLKRFG
ncbi:MAG: SDR family NAD(P)-dependent oxidoreductase, partial [Bdellovibrionales bacterium]|nr:SDR family NAD(P)-dependent oxidoreductase [Bdellovibrionales bacterium]